MGNRFRLTRGFLPHGAYAVSSISVLILPAFKVMLPALRLRHDWMRYVIARGSGALFVDTLRRSHLRLPSRLAQENACSEWFRYCAVGHCVSCCGCGKMMPPFWPACYLYSGISIQCVGSAHVSYGATLSHLFACSQYPFGFHRYSRTVSCGSSRTSTNCIFDRLNVSIGFQGGIAINQNVSTIIG